MEHIEEAGVHSGDSACAIPPYSLPGPVVEEIREATTRWPKLNVVGLMNVQFAVKKEDGRIQRLRAGSQPARQPHRAVRGQGDRRAGGQDGGQGDGRHDARRAGHRPRADSRPRFDQGSVFPFRKFVGVDIVLGPEMRSTGEVMGISERFSIAFAKSQLAAGVVLPPRQGKIFLQRRRRHKEQMVDWPPTRSMGYELIATEGTAKRLEEAGIRRSSASRRSQEGHPN
jgi:carbamoyl-phosphate synthase large subunit